MPRATRNTIPDSEDFQNVVEYYRRVFGLKSDDAIEQALEDYNRGPNSPVFAARAEHANKWLSDQRALEQQKADEQLRQDRLAGRLENPPPAVYPQPALPPGANLSGSYPEDVMADPRMVDPQAWAAQDALNKRRDKLDNAEIYADPMAQSRQMRLDYRRQQLDKIPPPLPSWAQNAVPLSPHPAPLTPAAPTPEHLEDANLSSWQSLASLLGFDLKRR